jgi:hypothetical protein
VPCGKRFRTWEGLEHSFGRTSIRWKEDYGEAVTVQQPSGCSQDRDVLSPTFPVLGAGAKDSQLALRSHVTLHWSPDPTVAQLCDFGWDAQTLGASYSSHVSWWQWSALWGPCDESSDHVITFVTTLKKQLGERNCIWGKHSRPGGQEILPGNRVTVSTKNVDTSLKHKLGVLYRPSQCCTGNLCKAWFRISIFQAGRWLLTAVILATQEVEIRGITVWSQPGQIVCKTQSQKTHHTKGLVEWLKW